VFLSELLSVSDFYHGQERVAADMEHVTGSRYLLRFRGSYVHGL